MAQVVLENIYKSFPARRGGTVVPVTAQPLMTPADAAISNGDSSDQYTPGVNILRRINLTVADGEFMVLVGPSGCGKSTLLRLIAGLEEMTGGNIWVGEHLVNDLPPKARDIAMVFQNYALYPHMTVYNNIAFGLRRTELGGWGDGVGSHVDGAAFRRTGVVPGDKGQGSAGEKMHSASAFPRWAENLLVGMTRSLPQGLRYPSNREKTVDERVRTVAQLLQITALLERLPKQLSGGQKQRVALGRAIARNPQVFLMDEPLSNLDAKLRAETRAQIVKLQRQLGTTTIYVTHDQTEAMTMGDRIAVMCAGRIQQVAHPLELYNRPATRFVAEFIGSPPMNFLSVQFHAPLLITHPQFRLTLPDAWATPLQKYDGQSLVLGIRPEHLSLSVAAPKNLPVQVDLVEALGNETYLSVSFVSMGLKPVTATTTELLQARVVPDRVFHVGEQLWLSLAPDKIHFFDPETGLSLTW